MPRSELRQLLLEAYEPEWFKALTKKEQQTYLKNHPGSKLNPSFHAPTKPVTHPVEHPAVVSSLKPRSPERIAASHKVKSIGQQFEDYYSDLPQAHRMETGRLIDRVVKNKPMRPQDVSKLARTLNTYQAWAKGLDEKKVGYGVLKGAGALGAIGLALSPAGSVGLALGSVLIAAYAAKKGMPFALKALKLLASPMSETKDRRSSKPSGGTSATNPNTTALPPRLGNQQPQLIPPGPGPRPGDHLAALASYFEGANWVPQIIERDNVDDPTKYVEDMRDSREAGDANSFRTLFNKLAEVVKSAHLTPEQWKPLLAYTRRRF